MFPQPANSHPFSSLHNITCDNHQHCCAYFLRLSTSTALFTHTGIRRFFTSGSGNLPVATSDFGCAGRGSANCSSHEADNSSALASINDSSNCAKAFLKLAIRFIRLSLNSAICPLLSVSRYCTMRRSRSSAVNGLDTTIPSSLESLLPKAPDSQFAARQYYAQRKRCQRVTCCNGMEMLWA
jgi:hypothetical protein